MTADRYWYELGDFQVLVAPLQSNPAFRLYRIHSDGKQIGSQISVPSEDDCRTHRSRAELLTSYDRAEKRSTAYWTHRKPGPGRPRGRALTVKRRAY